MGHFRQFSRIRGPLALIVAISGIWAIGAWMRSGTDPSRATEGIEADRTSRQEVALAGGSADADCGSPSIQTVDYESQGYKTPTTPARPRDVAPRPRTGRNGGPERFLWQSDSPRDGEDDPPAADDPSPRPNPRESSQQDAVTPLSVEALREQLGDRAIEDRMVGDRTVVDDWHLPLEAISPEMEARRSRIRQVLEFYYQRPLNSAQDSPWSMMHFMLAWGVDGAIEVGGPGGRRASLIGWLCANGPGENVQLLEVVNGRIHPRSGPGLQGHDGQFLAMLAQARVPIDQPLRVQARQYSIGDLIEYEQRTCRSGNELTFKLIGLVHYLGSDAVWQDDRGHRWDIPRLMEEEIRAPINGVTCGGTHRLMSLKYAVRRRQRDGGAVDGVWQRADEHVAKYQELAFRLQNRDGSMSSDFFRNAGSWGDIERKLKTSGHMLEWLVYSLPHKDLHDPRLKRGIDYLCNLLIQNRYHRWGRGPLGHSIRALSLYEERVFGTAPGNRNYEVARAPARPTPRALPAPRRYPMHRR